MEESIEAQIRNSLPQAEADKVIEEFNTRRAASIRARFERSEQRSGEKLRIRLNGWRKMTADELEHDLRELVDQYDLPVEIDGGVDRIPVIFRHMAWTLYFFPKTVPVRIERLGELPDRSDEMWLPLWNYLAQLGTAREAVKPLSKLGYRLLAEHEPADQHPFGRRS